MYKSTIQTKYLIPCKIFFTKLKILSCVLLSLLLWMSSERVAWLWSRLYGRCPLVHIFNGDVVDIATK